MASNGNIAVQDGQSTPVTHTYQPSGIFGDIAKYQNKAEPFFAGRETLQVRLKSSGKVRTVNVALRIPRIVDETINGVTAKRVVDFASVNMDVIVPLTWEASKCKDVRTLGGKLLLDTLIGLMVDEGEFVW